MDISWSLSDEAIVQQMSTTQVPQLVDDSRTRKVNALLAMVGVSYGGWMQ
ncbi:MULTISPECIES: hypothetical protein [unclassified Nostoc]|nr:MULTISPECIES: hypothetical protein [unclassified Nostoc]